MQQRTTKITVSKIISIKHAKTLEFPIPWNLKPQTLIRSIATTKHLCNYARKKILMFSVNQRTKKLTHVRYRKPNTK